VNGYLTEHIEKSLRRFRYVLAASQSGEIHDVLNFFGYFLDQQKCIRNKYETAMKQRTSIRMKTLHLAYYIRP